MLNYALPLASGRIWTSAATRPKPDVAGLCLVLQEPASSVHSAVRAHRFTAGAYDDRGEYLAAVDSRGVLRCYHLSSNRAVRLDSAGVGGTACVFSPSGRGRRTLFVGFEVSRQAGGARRQGCG